MSGGFVTGRCFCLDWRFTFVPTASGMTVFDIDTFERRVSDLVRAYDTLKADHEALVATHAAEVQRNQEVRSRLAHVIERIRALEAETQIESRAAPRATDADDTSGASS